jgi:L-ribulose-5-phosphate 3-epimerase
MHNHLCLNGNTYHGFTLDDAVEGARRSRIRYMELAAVRGWTEHVSVDMTDAQIREVRDLLSESDITPLGLGGHSNLTTDDGRANFRANLRLAHLLGASYVVTGTGETHGDEGEIEDENALIQDLRGLADIASTLSLDIAIETHGANYNTGARVNALLAKVERANVGIAYDTGNVIFYADTEPYGDLQASARRVRAFHLKDKRGGKDVWDFPAIGEGDLDLARFTQIVETTKCTAPLSLEIEFTPGIPDNVELVHTAVATSVRNLSEYLR